MRSNSKEPLQKPDNLPQMLMPDGQIYRWEREEDGVYKHLASRGGMFRVVATGDRKAAVEWAKTLRSVGGKHQFRSVTQLVSRSFPLSLTLFSKADRKTTGGPGTASFCQYERTVEIIVHAKDQAFLRENFREWGFGWSERQPPVEVEIPRPFTEDGIREAAENFRIEPTGFYEKIMEGLPWLVS